MEKIIHKVLALKYRPKNFKELIGQDIMVQTITNSINLNKLPNEIEDAISNLDDSKELKESFGEEVINSYIKLRNKEIEEFNRSERFDKSSSVTDWEKNNTLDC